LNFKENILVFRTRRPILINLVKRIQNCSNKGPFKGEISTKMKEIWWGNLKIFFSRTTRPEKRRFT
jgi:hypothetical protein